MDIRELLKGAFNEDLHISGGMGNSIDAAVVLESAGPLNDYISLEYQVMDLIVDSCHVDPPFLDVDPPTKQAIRVRA